jgi:hypothetical protein
MIAHYGTRQNMSRCKTSDQKVGGSNPSRHGLKLVFVSAVDPHLHSQAGITSDLRKS